MWNRQSARRFATLLFVLTVPVGCHGLDRPVSVLVRDAETQAPLAGAAVSVNDTTSHPPRGVVSQTGDDGIAHLRLSPSAEFGYSVETTVAGYLPAEKDLSTDAVRTSPSGPLVRGSGQNPTIVLDVFKGPRPTVELVVPRDYHGLVRVELEPRDNVAFPPGQRAFRFDVPTNGIVQAVAPRALLAGITPEVSAFFPDGSPISREAKDEEVGFRWVKVEGTTQIFVIGTRIEWFDIRKALEKAEPPASHGGGRSGNGGGGGGGRGGGRGMGGGRGGGMGR